MQPREDTNACWWRLVTFHQAHRVNQQSWFMVVSDICNRYSSWAANRFPTELRNSTWFVKPSPNDPSWLIMPRTWITKYRLWFRVVTLSGVLTTTLDQYFTTWSTKYLLANPMYRSTFHFLLVDKTSGPYRSIFLTSTSLESSTKMDSSTIAKWI